MVLLAKEPLRGRGRGCEVSLSQDGRRTGRWFWVAADEGSWRISASSSELASASESGVVVLALTFSSNRL